MTATLTDCLIDGIANRLADVRRPSVIITGVLIVLPLVGVVVAWWL